MEATTNVYTDMASGTAWEYIADLAIFNDPLAFGLFTAGVALTIVLVVLYNITTSVGKGVYPKSFVPNPKPKPVKEESTVLKALTAAVPIEKEAEIMMDHEYDGIHELDNDLPPWWKYGFYLCIIWGAIYFTYYHVSSFGPSSAEEFEMAMEEGRQEVAAYQATLKEVIDENTVTLLEAPGLIEKGEMIYKKNCFPCHGMNLEGGNGPNLTDEYWIHGGDIKDIFKTVKFGVSGKGMASWSDRLSPKEMQQVSSYILTMQGTNPQNAKGPEGKKAE